MSLELHVSFCNQRRWLGREEKRSPTAPDAEQRVHSGWEWRDCVPGDIMRRWAGNFRWLALVSVLWKNEDYIKVGQDSWYSMKGCSWVWWAFERDPRGGEVKVVGLETCSRV